MRLLITGVNGYICEDCVQQAYEILQTTGILANKDKDGKGDGKGRIQLKNVPKPKEIKEYMDQ